MRNRLPLIVIWLCLFTVVSTSLTAQRAHYIDEFTFKTFIKNRLDPLVAGYQYSVGDETGALFSDYGGNRSQEFGFEVPWHSGVRMMTASISKMVCTVAIMHMLENNYVFGADSIQDKLDLKLKDYIPLRWRSLIDGTEGDITLKMLLRHHSGFAGYGLESNPKTVLMNTMNTTLPDAFEYQNINFNMAGFMAIYMAYKDEMAANESNFSLFSDQLYDASMIALIRTKYREYVQQHIFDRLGISPDCAATLDADDTEVYRYESKNDLFGVDMGNVKTCMSNGWILSAKNMVSFMQKWANPQLVGNILSYESVELINDYCANARTSPLGWASNRDAYDGKICGFGHNGVWDYNGHSYTSAIVMLNDHTYMAINVNSNATDENRWWRGRDLIDAYNASYCVNDLTLDESNMKEFNSASKFIHSNGLTIANAGEVNVFKAGNQIILKPGFSAETGSSFRAYLKACDSFPELD